MPDRNTRLALSLTYAVLVLDRPQMAVVGAVAAVTIAGVWFAFARDDEGSAASGGRPNLTATLEQYRTDEPLRQIRTTLSNHETEPVVVETTQLAAPDFEILPPREQDYSLPPGGTIPVGLRSPFGAGICNGELRSAARPAEVVVQVRAADGSAADYRYPLADPHDLLAVLLRNDCEDQKIASTLDIRFGDVWEQATTAEGTPAVRTVLKVRLVDTGATATITGPDSGILFNVHPKAAPTLTAAEPVSEVPVELTNNRCDPHAVAESKQSYIFPLWVAINEAEPISTLIQPEDAGKEALRLLVDAGCGLS